MQKLQTYKSIKIGAQNWSEFGFDDEYFINSAILDLHLCDIEFVIPGMSEDDRLKVQELEENSLILTSSKLYPSSFLYSCQ